MARLIDDRSALAVLHGKSIAVVGNSPEVLLLEYASRIDAHDVVIRMNRGIPSSPQLEGRIGKRTTIVTAGQLHASGSSDPLASWIDHAPPYLWWLKHTSLGDEHLDEVKRNSAFTNTLIWHWPETWSRKLETRLGAHPSAGLCVLDILSTRAQLRLVNVFGISCWGALQQGSEGSWWQEGQTMLHHNRAVEAGFIRDMGIEIQGPLWFELRCPASS